MFNNYAGPFGYAQGRRVPIDAHRTGLKNSTRVQPRWVSTERREWIVAVSIAVLIVALVALIGLAALSQIDTTEFVRLDFVSRGW